MSTAVVAAPHFTPVARARWVIGWRTSRKAMRSGLLWGVIFGLTYASSTLAYSSAYPTQADRERIAALFSTNAGLAAINGPARGLDNPAAYGVWKSLMFLMVIGAVWGLLMATRLLRGEEDAGRWELLIAGQTTRLRATVLALLGLATGVWVTFLVSAVMFVAIGRSPKVDFGTSAALYLALCFIAAPAMWVGIGSLTSQLSPSRRQAAAIAAAVLGVSYAIRMLADSSNDLAWLRWLSPLGWIETLNPLTGSRWLGFVPIVLLAAGTRVAAIVLAGQRDVGAALLHDGERITARTRLLSGTFAFSFRQVRATTLGWAGGVAAFALTLGLIAKQGGTLLTSSPTVEEAIGKLGVTGEGPVAYLGFTFLIVAAVVGFVAVTHVSAMAEEENETRLAELLVRPVGRWQWYAQRVVIAAACIVAVSLIAGLFAWIGALISGVAVSLWQLLGAGLNVAPPTICIFGIGALAFGGWPRRASIVAYAVFAWGFLVTVLSGFEHESHWLVDTSVFHHMAAYPAAPVNWWAAVVMVLIGLACAAAGAAIFTQRDVAGG